MENQSPRKRFVRLPEVESLTGYRRSRIYDFVKAGTFPRPCKLGPRSVGWIESEVQHWIDERIEQRDNTAA